MNRKKRILIIEDNLDILELYRIYFSQSWYEVHTSENGLTWIVDILNIQPDIILLDIMMPQMNGFEVLESISEHSSINIPIVVCSNLWQQSDIDRSLELWATAYITKSDYEVEEIVEKVDLISQQKGD